MPESNPVKRGPRGQMIGVDGPEPRWSPLHSIDGWTALAITELRNIVDTLEAKLDEANETIEDLLQREHERDA